MSRALRAPLFYGTLVAVLACTGPTLAQTFTNARRARPTVPAQPLSRSEPVTFTGTLAL